MSEIIRRHRKSKLDAGIQQDFQDFMGEMQAPSLVARLENMQGGPAMPAAAKPVVQGPALPPPHPRDKGREVSRALADLSIERGVSDPARMHGYVLNQMAAGGPKITDTPTPLDTGLSNKDYVESDAFQDALDRRDDQKALAKRSRWQGPPMPDGTPADPVEMAPEQRIREAQKGTPPTAPRKGVADSVPDKLLTPEQLKAKQYHLYQKQVPHTPNSGYHVWDQRLNDGEGGYAMRAPGPHTPAEMSVGESRSALDEFQKEGLDATEARDFSLNDRAVSLGIDPSGYTEDMKGQMEADMAAAQMLRDRKAKHYDIEAIPGGGHKWVPNADTRAANDRIRREQFLRREHARWEKYGSQDRDKDGRPDFTYGDLEATYDAGEGLTHAQRALQVRTGVDLGFGVRGPGTDQFRAQQAADSQAALRERNAQNATAQRMGTSVANVMFQRDLQNAKSPEDMIRTLLGYHAQAPELGLDAMASHFKISQDEEKTRQQQAAEMDKLTQTPGEKYAGDLKNIQAKGADPAVFTELEALQAAQNGGTAQPPKSQAEYKANNGAVAAKTIYDKMVKGAEVSPQEREYLLQWTKHVQMSQDGNGINDYRPWSQHLGEVDPFAETPQQIYKELTGEDGISAWNRLYHGRLGG